MRAVACVLLLSACAPAPPAKKAKTVDAMPPPAVADEDVEVASEEPPPPPEPVEGPFSSARVREIVRANFERLGDCYADGLARDPKLAGTISVSLTIDGDGAVLSASAPKKAPQKASDALTDSHVVGCVEDEFKSLRFPPTGRGMVSLVYPVVFGVE